jgi:hypothetical protein
MIAIVASGCRQQQLIEKINVKPTDDLKIIRVSLVFGQSVKSDFGGRFALKHYGELFVQPYAPPQPFEAGFDMNFEVFNEQDYVQLTPTSYLPNGVPIGLPHPLVEIRGVNPISDKFDLHGYVDILNKSWLGVAAMFSFLSDQYFPPGLSISQVFLRDDAGNPGVLASVFGPTVNGDGSLKRAGGIALFANVRQLVSQLGCEGGTLYPETKAYVNGYQASRYRNTNKLLKIERQVVRGFNQ